VIFFRATQRGTHLLSITSSSRGSFFPLLPVVVLPAPNLRDRVRSEELSPLSPLFFVTSLSLRLTSLSFCRPPFPSSLSQRVRMHACLWPRTCRRSWSPALGLWRLGALLMYSSPLRRGGFVLGPSSSFCRTPPSLLPPLVRRLCFFFWRLFTNPALGLR